VFSNSAVFRSRWRTSNIAGCPGATPLNVCRRRRGTPDSVPSYNTGRVLRFALCCGRDRNTLRNTLFG
jgi:hypothetical protein